jgi:hypothetical protein
VAELKRWAKVVVKAVFLLWHTRKLLEGDEDSKLVGVYESQASAERAKERASRLPGFGEQPNGFEISAYEVGRDQWPEGFVTLIPSEK